MALEHREPDRVPTHDNPWQATIDRWRTEGLPSGIEPADYFGYELVGFGADTGPRFKEEVISIDDEYIVERDSYGGVRKNLHDIGKNVFVSLLKAQNLGDRPQGRRVASSVH